MYGQKPYQVANELVGVRGETIRRERHTKRQAALSLRASVRDAPTVKDDTGRGISKRLGEGPLGKSRRQVWASLVLAPLQQNMMDVQEAAAARAPMKREVDLILLDRHSGASTSSVCEEKESRPAAQNPRDHVPKYYITRLSVTLISMFSRRRTAHWDKMPSIEMETSATLSVVAGSMQPQGTIPDTNRRVPPGSRYKSQECCGCSSRLAPDLNGHVCHMRLGDWQSGVALR